MYNFTFHRPTTVRQAAGLLARNPEAKLLAGGHSLIPVMKQRLAQPSALIDLSLVEGLTGVEQKGRSIVIGAMTRHADVANSPVLQQALPGLGRGAGRDRRSAGAQPRHHRRLDRQQRSERRLSGGRARAWAPPSSPTSGASRPTISSPACSRPRWKTARSSPRSASRSPRRRPTRSSSTRPRASRWSACSCPSAAPTSAWR